MVSASRRPMRLARPDESGVIGRKASGVGGRAAGRAAALLTLGVVALSWATYAAAEPRATILRIDPRAGQDAGTPVLTTVFELIAPRGADYSACLSLKDDAEQDCTASANEKIGAYWTAQDFKPDDSHFLVKVDGTSVPASYDSHKRWSDLAKTKNDEGVGTAWLILVDAAASMGDRFDEAKGVASTILNRMGPNDIVKISYFNDQPAIAKTEWTTDKSKAQADINKFDKPTASTKPTRPLGQVIQKSVNAGFGELGNDAKIKVPLHQALVVISNGMAGLDAGSSGPIGTQVSKYLSQGRFPEDNTASPKTPVPVISIWIPTVGDSREVNQARDFLTSLANTDIGGLFSIVRNGQGARAKTIADAVNARFDKMWVVKWRVPCLAPTTTQSFELNFTNSTPQIVGDSSFKDVPIGVDLTLWPLEIDVDKTKEYADKNPIVPGGTVRVFGSFCWGDKKDRAELYMIPKTQVLPDTVTGNLEEAKKTQKDLIAAKMKGKVKDANDTFVEFDVPDTDKFMTGSGKTLAARLVIYDSNAHRASAITQDKVLTLKAATKPEVNWFKDNQWYIIGAGGFGATVLILLVINAVRAGGGKRRGTGAPAAPPPRPGFSPAAMPGPAPAPAPMPMGPPPAPSPSFVARATLNGPQGSFTILPSMEMKAGRDVSLCQILLTEPRVSGAHATLKIEGGQLFVRDDNSNNGTMVNGQRIPPGVWSAVGQGAVLRFGPVEFNVTLE